MRYEPTDHEWIAIRPMLPNKPRGVTPRRGAGWGEIVESNNWASASAVHPLPARFAP
jgi:hypothetical protein